jgi:hypothetical protein
VGRAAIGSVSRRRQIIFTRLRRTALYRALLGTLVLLALTPAGASASVRALVPFPTNLLTTPDSSQLTGVRVNLPKPDCATNGGTCADIDVLNRLDGFNVQPRISIPFDGPIDISTISNSTIHLLDTSCPACSPIGINQVVWEPSANTLHFESDELLKQDTTYLAVATTGLKDAGGQPVDRTSFQRELNFGQTSEAARKAYRKALIDELDAADVDLEHVAAASLFTTQSVTIDLEKIRRQIDQSSPGPVSILGSFERSNVSSIVFHRQTGTSTFVDSTVPLPALDVFPGSVGKIVFGSYDSPDYETAAKVIPPTGTNTGSPAVQGTNPVYLNLFLPSGTTPPGGWPVAIFGHGFGDNKNNSPFAVASTMAKAGIATIAINVVGHGGGPDGTLTVNQFDGSQVTIPAGGRGIDQDGNGTIDSTEGVSAVPPLDLRSNRDGLRQTAVDLMQLVREIQVGVDVDGPALDPSRIYYFGQSFGGIYGTDFLAVEPDVATGVPNVPGGSIVEISRLSPSFRPLLGQALFFHVPRLYNVVPNPTFTNFVENEPLRNLAPVVDTVTGASAIQEYLDRAEWAQESASPPAYAPHLRAAPLAGVSAKSVIVQFAKGDQTVPNPTATALIRAGGLTDRATYFRNDLARAVNPACPKNPHTFLTNFACVGLPAQGQIATFFSSDGAVTTDPDGPGALFETPIAGPLPEELNFIP